MARHDFQSPYQSLGLFATMRLYDADSDIHAIAPLLVRRFQHGIGFPHAGVGAEEDFELALRPPVLFSLRALQQCVRIWSL